MSVLGRRLRAERERIGLNQTTFGEIGGVQKRAQSNYETGERSPDANYLTAIAAAGVDVFYVLTGQRLDPNLVAQDAERASQSQRADLQSLINESATVSGPLAAAFAMPTAEQAWQAQQAERRAHEQALAERAALEAVGALNRDELELVAMFRAAGLAAKAEAIRALQGGAQAVPNVPGAPAEPVKPATSDASVPPGIRVGGSATGQFATSSISNAGAVRIRSAKGEGE